MRFYKLRVGTNAANIAKTFNEQFKPEAIPEVNDPFRVDWITSSSEEFIVGEKVNISSHQVLGQVAELSSGSEALGSGRAGICPSLANIWWKLQYTRLPHKSSHSHRH